jgi:hypothetical protein
MDLEEEANFGRCRQNEVAIINSIFLYNTCFNNVINRSCGSITRALTHFYIWRIRRDYIEGCNFPITLVCENMILEKEGILTIGADLIIRRKETLEWQQIWSF